MAGWLVVGALLYPVAGVASLFIFIIHSNNPLPGPLPRVISIYFPTHPLCRLQQNSPIGIAGGWLVMYVLATQSSADVCGLNGIAMGSGIGTTVTTHWKSLCARYKTHTHIQGGGEDQWGTR